MPETPKGFPELLDAHPWPEAPPFPDVKVVGRRALGVKLVLDRIEARQRPTVVVEIGAEFGGSTRQFLGNPTTSVISVDPWPDTYGSRTPDFQHLKEYFGEPGAGYGLFQSFCWDYRDRLVALRDVSPDGLVAIRDAGVEVDCVYVDGDHRYDAVIRDMTVAAALFPDAILCGDDWIHESSRKKYEGMGRPVQRAVTSWAKFHDVAVETDRNTWLIDSSRSFNLPEPPPRFMDHSRALADVQERVQRIERYITLRPIRERGRRVIDRLSSG